MEIICTNMQSLNSTCSIRYPPYSKKKEDWLDFLMKKNKKRQGLMSFLPIMMLGVVIAFVFKVFFHLEMLICTCEVLVK